MQWGTRIGNEKRPFQHIATPHPALHPVSSVGLSWEHMKIYEKHVRPSSSAASFPVTLRTQGWPPRDLKEVSVRRCMGCNFAMLICARAGAFALPHADVPSHRQAMDMPGPQDYVPVVGFAQKTKMRLTRGPPNSKNSKAPAHVFPVLLVFKLSSVAAEAFARWRM